MSSSSSAASSSASPALYFPEPDEMVVRVQLFGIMLCDQLEASSSAGKARGSRKRKRARVPDEAQCFQSPTARQDPILRVALYADEETDKNIVRCAKEVCAFANRISPDMPSYMRDAYAELLTTEDHVLQLASIYFFVSWHVDCDPDTLECTPVQARDPESARVLSELAFHANPGSLSELHRACLNFERGVGEASTMMSFVHALVCNRWQSTARVPDCLPATKKRHKASQRRFASSSSAAAASKSSSESSMLSSESSKSSAQPSLSCHSTSLSESLSESSPAMAFATSSQVLPSAKALSTS